jgi:methionyl-tRNA formyltransferase
LKIFSCNKIKKSNTEPIGAYISDYKTFLHFICLDGIIEVKELQLEGKKKMSVVDFLKGFRPH